MTREQVVRITCDRCSKVSLEPVAPEPNRSIDPNQKGGTDPRTLPFLALGGRLMPELLAEVTPGGKMAPPHATLDEVCAECQKRITDLVKQILYYRFKPQKTDTTGDNAEASEDTVTSEPEAPRANRSKRTTQTTEEKGS